MSPVFIVGAGFGVEARNVAGSIRGQSIYIGEYEIECAYPLVRDLPAICFPEATPPVPPDEVEDRLADSISAGDWDPVGRLCKQLQKADYYLAPRLVGASGLENPYRTFFTDFADSSFINFNYDSFVEFALLRAGSWSPKGGFGVDVGFEVGYTAADFAVVPSRSVVLHPHGSLLVYTRNFSFGPADAEGIRWMHRHDPADFLFDPHALGNLFHPITRVIGGLSYDPDISNRVIAPVPDKAEGLRGAFVAAVMDRARHLLREEGSAVSIGYAFSGVDEESYRSLLEALSEHERPRLVLVSPEAEETVERLRPSFSRITFVPQPMGFTEWVGGGYPGRTGGDA